ncbi:MAG: hypothetical protein PF448_11510 [Bacteroidales bacterium]|jgi:hypothetical protein|nr:hypothetical protein [Bacteroidales bacterium]
MMTTRYIKQLEYAIKYLIINQLKTKILFGVDSILTTILISAFTLVGLSKSHAIEFTVNSETTSPTDSITEMFGNYVNDDFNVYPNSSFDNLNLQFNLLKGSKLSCMIYDESGELVKLIDFGYKPEGKRHVVIQIDDFDSGKYKAQIVAEGVSITEWFEILK